MRCPICKVRVRDEDALQIHYIESCSGMEKDGNAASGDEANGEQVDELVEVAFKWIVTKDTTEPTIVLISSLAGQVQMRKKLTENAYKSAKNIVPCGVHSCQLVLGQECYPVVDVIVDPSSETVHIILQEDVDGTDRKEKEAFEPSYDDKFENSTTSLKRNGALEQDEIKRDYARRILDEVKKAGEEASGTDEDAASFVSHDSNCETARSKRRERQLEELASGETKNLKKIAKNGYHQVQVHAAIGTANKDQEEQATEVADFQQDDDRNRTERGLKGSIPDRLNGSQEELLLTPPNGFESSDRKLRGSTRRHKTLSKIAQSKNSMDSLNDQATVAESLHEKQEDTMPYIPLDEKPKYTWGYDDELKNKERTVATANSKENAEYVGDEWERGSNLSYASYQSGRKVKQKQSLESEEMISDLIRKCDDYKTELDKTEKENEELQKQLEKFLEKSRDQLDELLNKDEKIQELQAKCDSYETEMDRIKSENSDLMSNFAKLQEENEKKLQEEVSTLENSLDSVLRDNKELKEENESLQTANKLQREDMDGIIQQEIEELKSKLNNVKAGNRTFQYEEMRKIHDLETEVAELRNENNSLKKQLSRIKKDVYTTEDDGADVIERLYRQHSDDVSARRLHKEVEYSGAPRADDRTSRRSLAPSRNLYDESDSYEDRARPHDVRRSLSEYDKYRINSAVLPDYKHKDIHDRNHNHLFDDSTIRTSFSRRRENGRSTSPVRASHFDYLTDYRGNLRNDDEIAVDVDQVVRRERKPRRERPRSYHGASASENDSRHFSRNLPAHQHDDLSQYIPRGASDRRDGRPFSTSPDPTLQHLKPFAPNSIDEISIGVRVLITRSSGRIGKGVVKWKGLLDGHKEPFIGVELETPNGKHDGVYDNHRYFICKKDHGVFAKFSKVVMAFQYGQGAVAAPYPIFGQSFDEFASTLFFAFTKSFKLSSRPRSPQITRPNVVTNRSV